MIFDMSRDIRHTGEHEGLWTGNERGHSLCDHPAMEDLRELRELRGRMEKIREAVSSLWQISKKIDDKEVQHQVQSILSRIGK